MILVIDHGDSFAVNHNPEKLGKTVEELQQIGVLLEEFPTPDIIEGKSAVLQFDGAQLYYEYVDIPLSPEDELVQIKTRLQATEDVLLTLLMSI